MCADIESPNDAKYSIITAGNAFIKNAVGPTTKKNTAMPIESTKLIFDSTRMPLATPETAEAIVAMVSTMMMIRAAVLPAVDQPETTSKPLAICKDPIPKVAAVPNSVATIAKPSIMRAGSESVDLLPSSGNMIELIRGTRPRRKET